jgi:tetratricopeptide (TPR) repeat protein
MTLDGMRHEAALRESRGEHASAVALWRAVVDQEPEMPANHASLGAILSQAGQLNEAIAAYEQAVARGGSAKVYRELAVLYDQVNRPDAARNARERYEQALRSSPLLRAAPR